MDNLFHHEILYRGEDALAKLAETRVTVCGAGAVGSNLVQSLVRQGLKALSVIDFDRVEAHNIGTQTYNGDDIGAFKVDALQAEMFRVAGIEITAERMMLTTANARKLLRNADVVVDGFDNHTARAVVKEYCHSAGLPCLHVGLSAEYAEILWNVDYRVPHNVAEGDVCDYPLARNLITFAVALASESLLRFIIEGRRENYSFTLRDLQINKETAPHA